MQSVQISIYSHPPEVHDGTTLMPGSLKRSVDAIRFLKFQGLKVIIANVLMTRNMQDYAGVRAPAAELGVECTLAPTITPIMDGDRSTLSLGDQDALRRVFRDASLVGDVDEFCALPRLGVHGRKPPRTLVAGLREVVCPGGSAIGEYAGQKAHQGLPGADSRPAGCDELAGGRRFPGWRDGMNSNPLALLENETIRTENGRGENMAHPSAAPDREWSLLLAACSDIPCCEKPDRIRLLLREPIRWKVLFDLAERHGAQSLLHQALLSVNDAVPAEEMASFQPSYRTNLHKALLLSRELIRIMDHLSARGIEALAYKGLALAEVAYGDIALRPAGDIDLLIRPQDLSRIRDAVRDLGYTTQVALSEPEERAYLKSGYECAFDGLAGRNLLEVQWAIEPKFYAVDFDMDGLFRRAIAVTVAGYSTKTPSPEDLLLVLTAHAAKHVWGRLIWLCDLARIMSLPSLDWQWIGTQAKSLGIVRLLRVAMLLAKRLLGSAIPAAAEASFPEDSAAAKFADEIQTHIVSGAACNVESWAYFRLMMRLRERPCDRLRFLHRLVFTPGPGEWNVVRLPAALFPLYRLVRLSRLAARLVRT